MAKNKLNRFLALESETIIEQRLEGSEEPTVGVEAAAAELGEVEEALDESLDVHGELSALANQVQTDADNGKLSAEALGYANALAKVHLSRVGLGGLRTGLESSYSAESVGSRIKEVWEMVKKFVTEFLRKLNLFFQSFFSASGRRVKECEQMISRLKKVSEHTAPPPIPATLEMKKLTDAKGEFWQPLDGLFCVEQVMAYAFDEVSTKYVDHLKLVREQLDEMVKVVDDSNAFTAVLDKYRNVRLGYDTANTFLRETHAAPESRRSKEYKTLTSDILLGDRRLIWIWKGNVVQNEDSGKGSSDYWAHVAQQYEKHSVYMDNSTLQDVKFTEVPGLNAKELTLLLEKVKKISADLLKYATVEKSLSDEMDRVLKSAGVLAGHADAKGADDSVRATSSHAVSVVKAMIRASSQFSTVAAKYSNEMLDATMAYARANLKEITTVGAYVAHGLNKELKS
jgi:hypothetical protein